MLSTYLVHCQAVRRIGFVTVDSLGSVVRFDPPAKTARPISFCKVMLASKHESDAAAEGHLVSSRIPVQNLYKRISSSCELQLLATSIPCR
jgi:hypothetical protein